MTRTFDTAAVRQETPRELPPFALGWVLGIAAVGAIALLATLGQYGFFGDELYFVSAGHRLSVGYADQGPLVPAIAWFMDLLAPGSMVALRLPSVLVTVAAMVLSALIAREFGGSRAAQVLTAIAYATSPFLLVQGIQLSTNSIDTALWVLISWLVIRWVRTRRDALLLWAAAVTALDLQVKWLVPFLWAAIAIGVLCYGPREMLRRPALWAGAAGVFVTMLPTLIWQARHGWPQLGMGAQVAAEQDSIGGRLMFVPMALASAGVIGTILLLGGVWALLRMPQLRPYRFLGLVPVLLTIAFVITDGRAYYVVGCYGAVMAAGAVFATRKAQGWRRWVGGVLVLVSVVLVAAALPLQPESEVRPAASESAAWQQLSVYGRFGWEDLAQATEQAYLALPAAERANAVVITDSYWQASALDLDRAEHGLPPIYSPNRGFGYFGTPPDAATTVIWVGGDGSEPREHCAEVTAVGRADARLGIPGVTRDITLWRCDHPRAPWSREWPNMLRLG
ncbi:glycosyltransferase family 39 protein [Nocardia sp. NBC_01503]|uniref:ArnT family glycosyltransferase n=1 Tax=Nocardia sp. NBC_01503 TaxID=2975997 RepID=UPI002E7B9BB2|nr:glycosyltransferase family 39 protein [Nocardia sp. NBC_01503]WTL31601.1 glycosyltransferase family 39 protein [Nocardia sp. NBC_01503]